MFRRRSDPRLGFSLIEVIVTVAITAIMMVGLYTLLDSSNRVAKQQTQVADAQAGSRQGMYELARLIRQRLVEQDMRQSTFPPAEPTLILEWLAPITRAEET